MTQHPVALVTGSGKKRLGWHIARSIAGRGFALALHYNTSAAEASESLAEFRARGVEAISLQADLTDEPAVHELFRSVARHFGRLDALVNCVSCWERRPLEAVTACDVRAHFETNVLSTFLCSRAGGLIMVDQAEGGCIVNLGDWAEARPYPDYAERGEERTSVGAGAGSDMSTYLQRFGRPLQGSLSRFQFLSFPVNVISHLGMGRCAWISSLTPSHCSA